MPPSSQVRRIAAQPVDPGLARKAHQEGFGLIVGSMAQHDMADPPTRAQSADQAIARAAGLILKVAVDLAMIPDKRIMTDPSRLQSRATIRASVRRLGPQAVIDRNRMKRAATMRPNAREEVQKREGIAAARDRDADPFRPIARIGPVGQMQKEGVRALVLAASLRLSLAVQVAHGRCRLDRFGGGGEAGVDLTEGHARLLRLAKCTKRRPQPKQ